MHSCLYEGWLRHRRLTPAPHVFSYRLYMTYVDLAELDEVFRGRWLWSTRRLAPVRFRRRDHLGEAGTSLDASVRDHIEQATGSRPRGPIRLLTHLAHFGHCFSPVSFYYCFDSTGEHVESILAEITNTPWAERSFYVLQAARDDANAVRDRSAKTFHVSPFMPMKLSYDWRLNRPDRVLSVRMDVADETQKLFDATLVMRRRPITGASLARTLVRYPFMPTRILAAIYWQALRLWLKGATFHPHPGAPERSASDLVTTVHPS